ncbi:histidine phosphatase family protein [Sphingobium sp. AR-3-1]|uniref:Histidine phosphatase family protein n=1 Tax=Sphingobium psychrophilum TaxID=2728834 RepID=A0A7X9WVC1_9SPHN|nr:histidine phosphatase family protein [Sphingobium psychrophilum]NML10604.1 histidine phosphatase family protein [Sphingobium psychrophilum]
MNHFLLHLLRHGEPKGAGRLNGHTDARPTAAGIAACADRARDLAIEALLSSNLSRARLAAEAIGRATGLSVTLDARWRELDFGAWDGLRPTEVDGPALSRFQDDPDRHPPPGGERWSALTGRISAAIDALAARSTLVVTHGGAMRAAVAILCGLDARQVWAIDLPYASLLSLRVWRMPDAPPMAQIVGLRT